MGQAEKEELTKLYLVMRMASRGHLSFVNLLSSKVGPQYFITVAFSDVKQEFVSYGACFPPSSFHACDDIFFQPSRSTWCMYVDSGDSLCSLVHPRKQELR